MRHWHFVAAFLIGLLVIGCASTPGVVPIGPDTFMVSRQAATGFTGNSGLMAAAMREAGAYCRTKGKTLQVVSTHEAAPPFIFGNFPRAEVQFMCLASDDPELARPKLHPVPDVVIGAAPSPAMSTPVNPPPAETVRVAIESEPSGADVSVDGSYVGNTPLPDFRLQPGKHIIKIEKNGFEAWTRNITITPATPTNVRATLESKKSTQ